MARGLLHQDIAGVMVRLFKYLINDYYDEFVSSVNEWVLRGLEVLPPQAAAAARRASPLGWRGNRVVRERRFCAMGEVGAPSPSFSHLL